MAASERFRTWPPHFIDRVCLGLFLGLGLFAMVSLALPSVFNTPLDYWMRAISLVMIIWGSMRLGHRMIVDHMDRLGRTDSGAVMMLAGAVALSGVSFATTMFGMAEFASQRGSQTGADGTGLVGWFISLLTTFGIQIIMLFIALRLGEQLVQMRPSVDEQFEAATPPVGEMRQALLRNILRAVPVLLLAPLAMVLLGVPFMALLEVLSAPETVTGLDRVGVVAAYGLVVLAVAIASGLLSLSWAAGVGVLLAFAYVGTLAVSSLFSFDSYYRLVQDDSDVERRRIAIVEETTSSMLRDAETSLRNQIVALQESPDAQSVLSGVETLLDDLQRRKDEINQKLAEDAEAFVARLGQRRDTLRAELQTRLAEKQEAIAALDTGDDSANEAIRARTEAETNLKTAQDALAALEEARDDARAEAATNETLAECERIGDNQSPGCEGTSGIAGERSAFTRFTNAAVAANARATRLENVDIPNAAAEVEIAERAFDRAEARVAAAQPLSVEAVVAARQQALDRINERFDDRIEEIQNAIAALPTPEQAGRISLESLEEAFIRFKGNPGNASLAEWVSECTNVRQSLLEAESTAADIRDLVCRPVAMVDMAQQGDALRAAQQRFQGLGDDGNPQDGALVCTSVGGLPSRTAEADVQAALDTLVDNTRTCLGIANRGQPEIEKLQGQLTELVSIYLGQNTDMRRSIEDLRRGSPFAVGAAAGAVFVDVLILVVGFLAALGATATQSHNPIRPNLDTVRDKLSKRAAPFSRDGTAVVPLQRFLSYLEPRRIHAAQQTDPNVAYNMLFRFALNRAAVRPEDEALVKAIMAAVPVRYQRWMPFDYRMPDGQTVLEEREAISQSVVDIMFDLAYPSWTETDRIARDVLAEDPTTSAPAADRDAIPAARAALRLPPPRSKAVDSVRAVVDFESRRARLAQTADGATPSEQQGGNTAGDASGTAPPPARPANPLADDDERPAHQA